MKNQLRAIRDWWNLRSEIHANRIERAIRDGNDRIVAQLRFAALAQDKVISFERFGEQIRLYVPKGYIDASQIHWLVTETFQEEDELGFVSERYLSPDCWVFDVGANVGNHSIYFAKIARVEQVIAFEPSPNSRTILQRNIDLNEARVTALPVALGRERGHCRLRSFPFNEAGTEATVGDGPIDVQILDAQNAARCDLLKIDVEGMAADVLAGGADFITEHRPAIMIELHPPEFPTGNALLARYGYKMVKSFEVNGQATNFVYSFAA